MKPPILQTAWHNRVFCPPAEPGEGAESFVVAAVSPDAAAVLWLEFRLVQAPDAGGVGFAEVAATWVGPDGAAARTIRQRYAADRVGVDPERAGVGIGECTLAEGASVGRVSDAHGSLAWDLSWTPHPPYLPLGERRAHQGEGAALHLWCAGAGAQQGAQLAGRVEHWPAHGRHVEAQSAALGGWQAVQVHRWHRQRGGAARALPVAWLWAAAAPAGGQPGARLSAVALPQNSLWGRRQVVLGRLWVGGRSWALDTAAERRRQGESEQNSLAWSFTARGPDASLSCRVDIPATSPPSESVVDAAGRSTRRLVAHTAGLEVELCPAGAAPQRLRFDQALCEQLAAAPEGGR